eukprot:257055_1
MQIPIRCPDDPTQWGMIELQGELSSPVSTTLRGMEIGQIIVKENGGVSMTIGNNLMEGKKVTLANPLLITEKGSSGDSHSLEVLGIIRWKYIFNKRPKPILKKIDPDKMSG